MWCSVGKGWGLTASIAFLTRSELRIPWVVRFLIRAALVEPLDIHAMVSIVARGLGI